MGNREVFESDLPARKHPDRLFRWLDYSAAIGKRQVIQLPCGKMQHLGKHCLSDIQILPAVWT